MIFSRRPVEVAAELTGGAFDSHTMTLPTSTGAHPELLVPLAACPDCGQIHATYGGAYRRVGTPARVDLPGSYLWVPGYDPDDDLERW